MNSKYFVKLVAEILWAIPILGSVLISSRASAGVADDFKKAEGVKGCAGIPYDDLSRQCREQMGDVDVDCKQVKWSCTDNDTWSVRTARTNVADLTKDVEKKENAKTEEEKKLSSAKEAASKASSADEKEKAAKELRAIEEKLDVLKRSIGEQKEKLKAAEERLVGARKETELRLAFGTKCLSSRKKVMDIFKDAIQRAERESDPAVKALVPAKKDDWQKSIDAHVRPMEEVTKGIEDCQKRLDGR